MALILSTVLSTRHVPFEGYMPVVWAAIPLWAITLVVAKQKTLLAIFRSMWESLANSSMRHGIVTLDVILTLRVRSFRSQIRIRIRTDAYERTSCTSVT